jgi:hypothetical protein
VAQNDQVTTVIKKAWSSPEFKARLLTDANVALAELGITVPNGTVIRVVEDEPGIYHYVLPVAPSSELSDEHLEVVVGGVGNLRAGMK